MGISNTKRLRRIGLRMFGAASILFMALSWTTENAVADRVRLSRAEALKWKMKPIERWAFHGVSTLEKIPTELQNLKFPMRSPLNDQSEFGPIMHQIQDGTWPPYYHAGIDIRGKAGQEVIAPVSGAIEAGYYGYVDEDSGKSTKYFVSLTDVLERGATPPWGKLYFEVAIVDRAGYRFELHHIDPDTLPKDIHEKALRGGEVSAGEVVGKLIEWPNFKLGLSYHHLHYNVVSPTGMYINPLAVSEPIRDRVRPVIERILGVDFFCAKGVPKLSPYVQGSLMNTKSYFVLKAFNLMDSSIYKHPPTVIQIKYSNGSVVEYDFSSLLQDKRGFLPDLPGLYLLRSCDESSQSKTKMASSSFEFYFKIPVPQNFEGEAQILIMDTAGNQESQSIRI